MDVLSSIASGSATPLPAMSAATWRAPCSKIATFCPMFAPGQTPGPPTNPATTVGHAALLWRQCGCWVKVQGVVTGCLIHLEGITICTLYLCCKYQGNNLQNL